MCYYNVLPVISKAIDDENFIYHGLYRSSTNKIILVTLQMVCLGVNEIVLLDTLLEYYAHEDGIIMAIRNIMVKPFSLLSSATKGLTTAFINAGDQDDDWAGRMINFERSTNAIVTESEKRICKLIAASEERIAENEEEMKFYISGIAENVNMIKKKRGDGSNDESSVSSYGSSHVTFTRADLNLPYPF